MAFRLAAESCTREAIMKCKPVVLEPIVKLLVQAPESYTGAIVNDLSKKRANILNIDKNALLSSITALVPLSNAFGYATELRSITQGRGIFNLEFNKYSILPQNLLEKLT
jgi:elongation factor G